MFSVNMRIGTSPIYSGSVLKAFCLKPLEELWSRHVDMFTNTNISHSLGGGIITSREKELTFIVPSIFFFLCTSSFNAAVQAHTLLRFATKARSWVSYTSYTLTMLLGPHPDGT